MPLKSHCQNYPVFYEHVPQDFAIMLEIDFGA